MNKFEKVLAVIFGSSLIVLAFIFVFKNAPTAVGSVAFGNSYHSTTTRAFNGTALADGTVLTPVGTVTSGDLGSIVITGVGTAPGVINIYDATSTTPNSQTGTSTLVSIPIAAGVGTYTFDLQYYRGLVLEIKGTVGTSTITWR